MAEINEFDDYLKDALSSLGEDVSPGDWDSFAEKLNVAGGGFPLKESSRFDDLIRDRMEGLEINADANYWELMESKIDQEVNAPEISDEALDQLTTDNLSNLYIPYNPTHWTLLSHRLEEEFNVRRKIVTYKLVEFSLMVLLLLTIVQFMPDYNASTQLKNRVMAETPTALPEMGLNPEVTLPVGQAASNPSINKNVSSIVIADNTTPLINLSATVISSTEEQISSLTLRTTAPSAIVSKVAKQEITTEKRNVNPPLVSDLEETRPPFTTNQSTLTLTELPVTLLAPDHYPDQSAIGLLKKFPKKVMIRLGAMTSADLNYIKTPSTDQFKGNGYQQYQLGYGGGIVLDLNYEKLTLSTGLIYRRINYYPQEDINVAGSFANGYQSHVFDAVNLNLLTIPMNLQFQINDANKKWKLHAITGASLNVLALNHYNITVNNLGSNPPGTSSFTGPTPDNTLNEDEIFREADIAGEGLFEGGTFERNHYFTANLGIGVERFISPRWSLFIQPVYQHEIFGKNLGLNRDRIHTFSVQIGAKSTFK